MLRLTRTLIMLLLALTSTVALALSIEVSDNRTVILEHYKYNSEVPKAKLIRVFNPFGSITTRNTSYNNIEISGVIQKIGIKPAIHQIDISDNNGVTEVVVSYPYGHKNSLGQLTGRFDLGIWLPSWVNIEMVTDFGDIKAKKHASNIIAKTQSGKIKIGSAGLVNANSNSGNINIDLYGERYQQAMQVSSKTGDVKVTVSQSAKVTLRALSNNPIKNNLHDYSAIKVTEFGGNELKAQLATKTTDLQLSAEQGQLFIHIAKKATHTLKTTSRLFTRAEQNTSNSKGGTMTDASVKSAALSTPKI